MEKINLYESLKNIINEYFEVEASEEQNFKDYIRSKFKNEIGEKILNDDNFLSQVFNIPSFKIKNKETEKKMKRALLSYQKTLKPITDRKFLAAFYFYTNNFPIVWNNYVEGKFENNLVFNSKEINKRIKILKDIYNNVFKEFLNSIEIKTLIEVEKDIEDKINKKIKQIDKNILSDDNLNVLKDIYITFRKSKIKEKIKSKQDQKINQILNKDNLIKLIKEILSLIENNQKIPNEKLNLLNGYIINDEMIFVDNIYQKESVFKVFGHDPRDYMNELFSILKLELNNGKNIKL